MQVTPRLGLPFLAAAQAQKHLTHNEALLKLDELWPLNVIDISLEVAPAAPAAG
jgi:hypothetical protein